MSELRWVLLLLGALVIGLTWAWGSGRLQSFVASARRRAKPTGASRREPIVDMPREAETEAEPADTAETFEAETTPRESVPSRIDRVVTVRFVPRGKGLAADKVVLALRAAGLRHGQYGIFHMFPDELTDVPVFSVANLTEPGSFDLTSLTETTLPGMNFFLVLPGPGDPVERFDQMVDTARELARKLDAELRDERGSSWSIQRERYVREEVIEYRHQSDSVSGAR